MVVLIEMLLLIDRAGIRATTIAPARTLGVGHMTDVQVHASISRTQVT
jgi:hypothetical protein